MAASGTGPTTPRRAFLLTGCRRRWLVGLGSMMALGALGWLAVWATDELGVRATARRAQHLIAEGQFEAAGDPLERWLQARPKSAEARYLAARRAIGLNRFEQGLNELRLAGTLGYPADVIDRQRGILLSRLGLSHDAEPLLRKIYLSAAARGSQDPELDEALARCYLETFQLRAADEVIKRWLLDDPKSPRAYFWKAEVLRHKADADQEDLIALYEKVLQLDHDDDHARIALAELYLKSHRSDDAAREFTTYLRRNPDNVEACLGLGQIAAEQGREEEAIRLLDRAGELAPKDYRPVVERGKLEIHRGRLAVALEFFDKAVQMDFTEPEVHYQRSLVLTLLGRPGEAENEKLETARLRKEKEELAKLLNDLLQSPTDVKLQLKAAQWLFDRGHPEEGRRWAEKILHEYPEHPIANRLLADYYLKIGNAGLANFYRTQAGAQRQGSSGQE